MALQCNLKEIRKERHLLQEDLGIAIDCDTRTIGRYERGERCPNLEMALRLAAYLNLQVTDIFKLEDE